MPIVNFSYAEIKDNDKFMEYVKAAACLLKEADIEVVVRGSDSMTMRGDKCTSHVAAVFRYPDRIAVEKI